MLELRNIKKDYPMGATVVHALKGVSIQFRRSEFVSILGPSGCGKTTLLNIIGGLDQYTDGDLIINGRSTKSFQDRDWDAYRNHSVGFTIAEYGPWMAVACAAVIAAVTFVICTAGLVLGRTFGTRLAGKASILVGAILIFIGLEIFVSSLL